MMLYQNGGRQYGSASADSYPNGQFCSVGFFDGTARDCGATIKDMCFVLKLGTPESAKEPIIIVPGIMGSRLNRVSDGTEAWPSIGQMVIDPADNYLDALILAGDGSRISSKELNPNSIIDKEVVWVFYNLVDQFLADLTSCPISSTPASRVVSIS